jgi:hypothetical protein
LQSSHKEDHALDQSTILPSSPSIKRHVHLLSAANLRTEEFDVMDTSLIGTSGPYLEESLNRSTLLPTSPSVRRHIGLLADHMDLRHERLEDRMDIADHSVIATSPSKASSGGTPRQSNREEPMLPFSIKSTVSPNPDLGSVAASVMHGEKATTHRLPSQRCSVGTGDQTVMLGTNKGDVTFFDLMDRGNNSFERLRVQSVGDESAIETGRYVIRSEPKRRRSLIRVISVTASSRI